MKFVKMIAVAATLVAGMSVANASMYDGETLEIGAIQSAQTATVLTVNATEAKLLGYDNDVSAIRASIQGNRLLIETIQLQGFTVEQIVGATGGENDLTFYAL